jgi:hypothetical protein
VANFRSVGWALLASFVALPVARAQSAADKATAEALFDDGKRLMEAKRFPEACAKLADSQRLDPATGTLLNLGLCYKSNGQTASAWSTYREAAAGARAAREDDREKLARDEATALEPLLTRLVIQVAPETASVPGVEIKRGGMAVPSGAWGVPTPVDPGPVVIDATAPGKKPLHLEALAQGEGQTTTVAVGALENAPAAALPPGPGPEGNAGAPPPADTGSKPGSTQRTLGYVVGGLGIVGLGVGAFYTLQTASKNESAKNICADPKGPCTKSEVSDHKQLVNEAKASQLNSFVGYGLGGVGLIAGAIIVLTAPSASSKAAAFQVTPVLGPGFAGLNVGGAL